MSSPAVPVKIQSGQKIERALTEGETHPYLIALKAGEYIRVVAEQKGVDLVLHLFAPSGEQVTEVDSPTGTRGSERLSEIAAVAGDYRVDVVGGKGTPPGDYEIRIAEYRVATEDDRMRVEGERVFLQGERLRLDKKFEEAIAQYREALELYKQAGDRVGEANALARIGWMKHRLDRWEEAAELCLQAAELYQQTEETTSRAEALNRASRMLIRLSRSEEALGPLQEAVRLFRATSDEEGESDALTNLANVHLWGGRFPEAVETYEQVLTVSRKLGNARGETLALLGQGELFLQHGKWNESRIRYESALGLAEKNGLRDLAATALDSLGLVEYREGRLVESRGWSERALALHRELENRRGQAIALNSLGSVLLKAGDWEGARMRYEEARTLFRGLGDTRGETTVTSHLGRVALAAGDAHLALSFQREALAGFERLNDPAGLSLTRYGIALALQKIGNLDEALQEIEVSLKLAEQQRAETESLDLRAFYFSTRQHYSELYIDILLSLDRLRPNQGFAARALEADEKRRARSLLDALAETRAEVRRKADPALREEAAELRQRLALAEDPAEKSDLLTRLDRVHTRMRTSNPGLGTLENSQTLTPAEIQQKLLDVDTLLLIYSLGEERSLLWRVTRSKLDFFELPPRERIETAAFRAYDVLSNRLRPGSRLRQTALNDLSDLVLKPVAGDLPKYRRLIIVADGALQKIPFGALPDPGADSITGRQPLLIERHPIISLPSASVGASLRRERRAGPLRKRPNPLVAVLADPVFDVSDTRVGRRDAATSTEDGGARGPLERAIRSLGIGPLGRLPYSRQEALVLQELRHRFGDVVSVLDFEANRQVLDDERWRRAPILHFATHGLLDDRQPELSGLVFSQVNRDGSPRTDGFLQLHEIYDLDLNADLVVLSACQTGTGKELRGEGLLGLTRGFLSIGVPQLVVSLWKVEDRATQELMTRFYRELFNGYLPPEALQRAQISMLRDPDWEDPVFWAGFIFVGDYERHPGGGIEARDTGGADPPQGADKAGLPPPKAKPKPPKREDGL